MLFKTKLTVTGSKFEEDNLIELGINAIVNQFFGQSIEENNSSLR